MYIKLITGREEGEEGRRGRKGRDGGMRGKKGRGRKCRGKEGKEEKRMGGGILPHNGSFFPDQRGYGNETSNTMQKWSAG